MVIQSKVMVIQISLIQIVPYLRDIWRSHIICQIPYVRGIPSPLHISVYLIPLRVILTCRLVQRIYLCGVCGMVNCVGN